MNTITEVIGIVLSLWHTALPPWPQPPRRWPLIALILVAGLIVCVLL